jgi:hypothetical protein
MGGGGMRRGYSATSRTRGTRGNGTERGLLRGDGAMQGRGTGRLEVAP